MLVRLFTNCLHILFPERESAARIHTVSTETIRSYVTPHTLPGAIALTQYQTPIIEACIKELKFHRNRHAAQLLAEVIRLHIAEQSEPVTLIPLPLTAQRERERGFNQIELVLQQLRNTPTLTIRSDSLLRTKHTQPQTSLPRKERLENVKDVFAVNQKYMFEPWTQQRVIIVDDVTTTGATLAAARATLAPYCPLLECVALAH